MLYLGKKDFYKGYKKINIVENLKQTKKQTCFLIFSYSDILNRLQSTFKVLKL